MRFPFKKAIISGILTITTLTVSLISAAIPAAAANPTSITIANQSVANGATFNVPVHLTTSLSGASGVAGAQANITFDPAKLQANSVTYNSGLFGASQFNVSVTIANGRINNTLGTISNLTSTTGGDAAIAMDGTWVTVNFTALTSNTMTTLSLAPFNGKYAIDAANNTIPVDTTNGVITVGTPIYADLVISAASTTGTTPNYDLHFTVKNQGLAAAAASTATYSIDGGAAVPVTIGALAVGATQTVDILGLTVSGQTDSIVITADSANVIQESNENNNTATTSYTVLPNLSVSAVTVADNTPADAAYHLNFTVTNSGQYAAAASTATYNDGTGVHSVAIAALAVGAHEDHSIAMTAPGLNTNITVIVDSANVVAESNETDNSVIVTYVYAPANAGTTGVSGTLMETFHFTVPTEVNWNQSTNQLTPGIDPQMVVGANTAARTMTITSNKMWDVQVKANSEVYSDADGYAYMTKYVTGGAYTPAVHLTSGLNIATTGEQSVFIKKVDQMLANGASADLVNQGSYLGGTITGYTRVAPVQFSQNISYADPALANPAYYHMVVTFTCNVSDY